MKKKVPLFVLVLACVLSMLLGGLIAFGAFRHAVGPGGMSLLKEQSIIENRFVGDYDPDQVRQAAEKAMIDALGDRWSYYLTPAELQASISTRENHYVGIGVTIEDHEQGLLITQVTPDSPADKAGLQPGEIISGVEGTPITPANRDESVDRIRGEAGTKVRLEILDEEGRRRTLEVTRDKVQSISARWEMLEDNVALLTIANFYTGAAKQVSGCLTELEEAGAEALILDVRNNPGGYVTEVTKILDQLLPEGDVFRIRYYNGKETVYTSDEDCVDLPMAVLVNENSYSAAELMAAQVHEAAGAPLVGTRTSGKGYAQNLYTLRDGSGVNLSDAKYFTGGGTSLIGTGLTPDPYIGLNYYRQWDLVLGRLDHQDDGQLQAAIRVLEENEDVSG